jgi:hypothetical protein
MLVVTFYFTFIDLLPFLSDIGKGLAHINAELFGIIRSDFEIYKFTLDLTCMVYVATHFIITLKTHNTLYINLNTR